MELAKKSSVSGKEIFREKLVRMKSMRSFICSDFGKRLIDGLMRWHVALGLQFSTSWKFWMCQIFYTHY